MDKQMKRLFFLFFLFIITSYSQTGKSTTDYSEIDNMVYTSGEALLKDMQYNFYRTVKKKYNYQASGFYFSSKYFIPERDIKVEMLFKESLKSYKVTEFNISDKYYNIEAVTDKEDKKVYSYIEFIKLLKKEKAVFVSFYENDKEVLNVVFAPDEEDIDYVLNYKL